MEYVADKDELVVKGDAKITMGNFIIQADEITFQKEQSKAIASGNVKIDNGKIYVVSDRVLYDLKANLVHADHSKAKVHDYYFNVESIDLDMANDLQTGTNAEMFHGPSQTLAHSIFVKVSK
jgi:lipopolysaccharide assembly outer membrane protein LptD (OstA)